MRLIDLSAERAKREVPTHCVWFWDQRAVELYGHAFGYQKLYAWSLAEAQDIAKERDGRIEAL